jgi:REP element-mobilizing transposase RayT
MSQSLAAILVHIVFSTKNREPLIQPAIEPELFAYIAKICQSARSPALIINGMPDHIHMLVNLGRSKSVADLVEEVKSSSSAWMKTKGHGFEQFYWQNGYGAFSIGQSGMKPLKDYIFRQKELHLRRSFQEELRLLFRRYGIQHDERFVWD